MVEDAWLPTACDMCYNCCGILAHVVDGVIVKIEGNPRHPHNEGRVCAKAQAGIMTLYDPNRLKKPLRRGNPEKGLGVDPKWIEITWDEALDLVAKWLGKIRSEDPRKLMLVSFDITTMPAYLAWLRAFGTPNTTSYSAQFFCGNGVHIMCYWYFGSWMVEPDLDYCNYLILWGSNHGFLTGDNPVGRARAMAEARARGMKLVVIDPIGVNAASKADEWIPIRPGTDAALALSMVNVLLNEEELYDRDFIRRYTNGPYLIGPDGHYVRAGDGKPLLWDEVDGRAKPYDDETLKQPAIEGDFTLDGVRCRPAFQLLKEHVKRYTPEAVAEITTVPSDVIRRVAKEFGEAAQIGSKIVLDGVELPYRPVAIYWEKGISQHKHAVMNGLSLCLLCAVVGNLDAVGGICGANAAGPDWSPQEGPDGLIVPSKAVTLRNPGYPPAPVGRPANLGLQELLPIAVYAGPFYVMSSLNPNMFGLEYKPEMLIVARANPLHTGADIETTVEFLKKFKFIVSFATRIDETAEFADVVLPDTVFCERLAPFINYGGGGRQWQMFDIGGCRTSAQRCKPATPWYWTWMVPVVKPQPEARDWIEVLYELAKRVGFQRELYNTLNDFLRLREPYRLGAEGEYSWAEIVDRWARSWCGEQYGLEYFMKHGFLVYGYHTVKQVYWRYFHRVRCPVYFEHFIEVGRRVLEVVEELGVPWDVSDYRPLPDWIPCPGYTRQLRGYDLYATPFKHPKHGFSHTYNNPWLKETILRDPYLTSVLINSETAESRGLRTGDEVWVESQSGKIRGRVLVTELVHPEVVGIAGQGGLWSSGQPVGREVGLHYNRLLKLDLTTIDNVGAAVDTCVRVKVYKVEEKP